MFISMRSTCEFRIIFVYSGSHDIIMNGSWNSRGLLKRVLRCHIIVISETMYTTCAYFGMSIKFHENKSVVLWVCILFVHCLHTKNTICTRSYSRQILKVVTRLFTWLAQIHRSWRAQQRCSYHSYMFKLKFYTENFALMSVNCEWY